MRNFVVAMLIVAVVFIFTSCTKDLSAGPFQSMAVAQAAKQNLSKMTPEKAKICKDLGSLFGESAWYARTAANTSREEAEKTLINIDAIGSASLADLPQNARMRIINRIYGAKIAAELPENNMSARVLGVYECTVAMK